MIFLGHHTIILQFHKGWVEWGHYLCSFVLMGDGAARRYCAARSAQACRAARAITHQNNKKIWHSQYDLFFQV